MPLLCGSVPDTMSRPGPARPNGGLLRSGGRPPSLVRGASASAGYKLVDCVSRRLRSQRNRLLRGRDGKRAGLAEETRCGSGPVPEREVEVGLPALGGRAGHCLGAGVDQH